MIEAKFGTNAMTPTPKASTPKNGVPYNGELSRLVTAAVVNRKFCDLLLTTPAVAMAAGYNGESFSLTPEEWELVVSIRASSLTDFAEQLTGNGHNGTSRGSATET